MKYLITTILFLFILSSFAQKSIEYSVNLPIEQKNRKSLKEQTINWINKNNITIVKETKDTIWANASINFNNTVVYSESKTYNRVYRDQTNGSVVYKLKLYYENEKVKVDLFSFKHQPSNSFDNLSFGVITNSSTAPKQTQDLTSEEYSLKVWNLLKKTVNEFVSSLEEGATDMADTL